MIYQNMLILTVVTNILGPTHTQTQYVVECEGGRQYKPCPTVPFSFAKGKTTTLFTCADVFTTLYSRIPATSVVVAVPCLIKMRSESG